jgi:hypothetical protein
MNTSLEGYILSSFYIEKPILVAVVTEIFNDNYSSVITVQNIA